MPKNVTSKSQLRTRWQTYTNAYPGFSHTHRRSLILTFGVKGAGVNVQSSLGQIGKVDHSSKMHRPIPLLSRQNMCNTNSRILQQSEKFIIFGILVLVLHPALTIWLRLWSADLQVTTEAYNAGSSLHNFKSQDSNSEWVSSFLTAHQHIIGYISALQWCEYCDKSVKI